MPHRQSLRSSSGLRFAVLAALVSGVAVFVNGYAVRAWSEVTTATTYTAVKNAVAAVAILSLLTATARRGSHSAARPRSAGSAVGLAYVAAFGGALPFVLFFEGLARASSVSAAFIHKTLIVWVGILAVGLLRERLRAVHLVAVALLVAGQALLGGGPSALQPGAGEAMIFAATLLWSVEVVVAKRLLATIPAGTVALARMGGGAVVLVGWVLASGAAADLAGLTARHWAWVSLTGLVLGGYVTLWLAALSRARALDVTAVLVGGALVTASLRWIVEGSAGVSPIGAAFVAAGVVLVIGAARRRLRPSAAP